VDSPAEVAEVIRARDELALPQGLVLVQPVGAQDEMDADLHDATLTAGLAELQRRGITGKDVTPFLLRWFHERTGGASLAANVALVLANARLAAGVAVAHAHE
jgi:pseudouridine-5'-phosphate glycosidase